MSDDDEWLHAPPDPHILESMVNLKMPWKHALGELIDNAFDAGATKVDIEFLRDVVRISDDGHGCDSLVAMIKLGEHRPHRGTRLGRFGIGGKDAMLWIGGLESSLKIQSIHGGRKRILAVNWQEHIQRNWGYRKPYEFDAAATDRGTTIEIYGKCKKPPHGQDWKALLAELGYIFAAAINDPLAYQIRLKRGADWEVLTGWKLPEFMDEPILEHIKVNDQEATIKCGIIADGVPNPKSGFTYWHGWRVIEEASSNGCGQFSPARICGVVRLDKKWKLSRHKDAIMRDADELYEEVERVCLSLLERADQIGMTIESSKFDAEVNARFQAVMHGTKVKAKRKKGQSSGVQISTGTGSKHTKAAVEQPGARFPSKQAKAFKIVPYEQGSVDFIGEVKPPVVMLNKSNPAIAEAWGKNASAIVMLAVCLLAAEYCLSQEDGQRKLKGITTGTPQDFSHMVGAWLSQDLTAQGQPLLKIVSGFAPP
jgi:hypothetical protein